jgi:hypothetical protein
VLIFLRIVSVLLWLIGAFLVAAVIHAMGTAGGARAGVAVAYIVGAIILLVVGVWLWRLRARPKGVQAPPQ